EDATHASSTLGVNLLVTGNLEKKSDKFYIHAELKDAKTLRSLRSETIEVSQAAVVSLEDKLLERASVMLEITVTAGTLRHLPGDETTEPGAYEFYAQGRGYVLRNDNEDVDRGISLLQTAIQKDSHFALAYANLALGYAVKYRLTNDLQWLDKAKPVCKQAISLNDGLAPAHLSHAMILEGTGDLDGAIYEFKRAIELDPTDDHTRNLLSLAYDKSGRLLQAEALLKEAVSRNRANWVSYDFLGFFYYRHAQYAQAEPLFLAATELAPDDPRAFYDLGGVYLAMGKYKEAEAILTRAVAIQPTYGAYSNLATARQYQRRYADAAAMFQKA